LLIFLLESTEDVELNIKKSSDEKKEKETEKETRKPYMLGVQDTVYYQPDNVSFSSLLFTLIMLFCSSPNLKFRIKKNRKRKLNTKRFV